jgi:mannonate dehydratase
MLRTMSSPWPRNSVRAFISPICATWEPDGSFFEADHLAGETDMIRLVAALMTEEDRRRAEGRADAEIPMRPDHGHLLGNDGEKRVNPGYSFIGRLKGLAELRGVMQTVEAFRSGRAA